MLIAVRSSQDFACCIRATCERTLEMRFRFRRIRLGRHQRDFTGDAIDLGLEPRFFGSFHCCHRFANAVPRVVEPAEVPMGSRQQ